MKDQQIHPRKLSEVRAQSSISKDQKQLPAGAPPPQDARLSLADCLLLLAIVLLSAVPYLAGLGFYSDDWGYVAAMSQASPPTLGNMFRELMLNDPQMIIRPLQVGYLLLGFKLFGMHPLGLQVFNSALLGLVAVLVYAVLRELRFHRGLAFALALIFGTMPHYSSNRVWISTHQATLSMFFALAGIYALLRGTRQGETKLLKWGVVAATAMVLSVMSYEISVGLIAAFLLFAWLRVYRRKANFSWIAYSGVAIPTCIFLVAGIIKALAQHRVAYHHNFLSQLGELIGHALTVALNFNLVAYGLKLPALLLSMVRLGALSTAAIAVALVIAVVAGAWSWKSHFVPPAARASMWLIATGLVVYWLGYLFLFPNATADFSTAGQTNRIAATSALGTACVWLGLIGLLCSLLRRESSRVYAFSIVLAIFAGTNTLAVSGIAHYWVGANVRQHAVTDRIVSGVPKLPPNSVLLLDGFCRFAGPAVVFESDWDATGAVQLALKDPSLKGDVVSPNLTFDPSEIKSTSYGQPEASYPYSDRLFVFNVQTSNMRALPNHDAARAYLAETESMRPQLCPSARDGQGENLF